MSLMQKCLGYESGTYVADFLFGCVSSFWYRRASCVCRARFACWYWERVSSWLVGAGSERQVIAAVCGSGIGDVLIELWFLFIWLDTLCEWRCERRVSICGEGGGPSTNVTRECCV